MYIQLETSKETFDGTLYQAFSQSSRILVVNYVNASNGIEIKDFRRISRNCKVARNKASEHYFKLRFF